MDEWTNEKSPFGVAAQKVQKAQKADFRPMRAGCGADRRKDRWNDKRKSPGVLQDRPLPGRCHASSHFNAQSCKAGQQVSLTTYRPIACGWAGAIFEVTSSFGQEQ